MNDHEYEQRLRQRHKELVRLLARNLSLEDILWEEITTHLKDINLRTELLRQRNSIVRDIHTEFRALNIEIPTLVEQRTEGFASFLEDLTDDESNKKRDEETESDTDR